MYKKIIQSIMRDALEVEIPSEEINLWPAVKTSVAAEKQSYFHRGEKMNATRLRRISWAALVTLTILALLTGTLLTPQGRAIAQNIMQYFTRSEGYTFPLHPSQIATDEADSTAPTAEPPAALISIDEAEKQAGFNAAELLAVPPGFNYLGARNYGDAISIEYEAQGGGGNLILVQSATGFIQSEWDKSPGDSIHKVRIGELEGEYVQGAFVVFPGATSAEWNPEAPIQRLRWVRDGIWLEMTKFGNVEAIAYLDKAGMISLAESLVFTP